MTGCHRTRVGQVSSAEEIGEVLTAAHESPDSAMLTTDSLGGGGKNADYRSDFLRVRTHALEQQRVIEQQRADKRYECMMAFFMGILALIGLFFAWYAARQWHKTQLKNRVLAQHIKEVMIYKEKCEEKPLSLDALTPEELFHYIEHEVSRRLLFLNPSFDRQTIMDEFHISKERVGAAFSQGSKYDSLPQFVNDLRLEYASKLLVTTDLSITDIMTKAGFSNASVFSRYFSRKYQITPTQYRRANS